MCAEKRIYSFAIKEAKKMNLKVPQSQMVFHKTDAFEKKIKPIRDAYERIDDGKINRAYELCAKDEKWKEVKFKPTKEVKKSPFGCLTIFERKFQGKEGKEFAQMWTTKCQNIKKIPTDGGLGFERLDKDAEIENYLETRKKK